QHRNLDRAIAGIYVKDIDFNFVKTHLLTHFRDYVSHFRNIQLYSTESGETNHKTMIKEGYRWSDKNDDTHQILQTYAKLDSFKICQMNIQADLQHPIDDELCDK